MKLKELREERARLAKQMRDLYDKTEKEARGFNADEQQKWEKMEADIASLDARIATAEKLEKREGFLSESAGTITDGGFTEENRGAGGGNEEQPDQSAIFKRFLVSGMGGLSTEERRFMQQRQSDSSEFRALGVGAGNTGGFTVAEDFMNRLEAAMKTYGGMLEVSEIIRTDTGADLPMPTLNYTSQVASIVGENTQVSSDSNTPFGVATLKSFLYATPVLALSYQLLQDSAFSENQIIDPFAEQLGRGLNAHLTTGTGTAQPEGIVTASASGKVGTTGQTLSVIYDDLVDLEHSVDPAYRPNAKFMLHDSSVKVLKKLKDGDGRPLWLPGIESAGYNTILGYAYQINQDMPVMAASAKSILFGRLDKYKTRIVKDVTMMRLTERYADYLQVGFLGFMRADGKLLDAGANPVKFYQNSAT